jgi:acyl-CoA synthetase (AMP-forming)/AMP-acid ligase II
MAAVTLAGEIDEFDLDAFSQHAAAALPSYAIPVFLRVRAHLEVTGTFKHQKTSLRSEGWGNSSSNEPIFVRVSGAYVPLTPERRKEIESVSLRL